MKKILYFFTSTMIAASVFFSGCKKDEKFNIFSLEDDIRFGLQVDSQIKTTPKEYPILDAVKYKAAYDYMEGLKTQILNTGLVKYQSQFSWKITLIDTVVLNAFATPGGYLYFYTGLIKFCDNEAELAGVLAHEMAHSDKRHSTVNMTKMYGYSTLFAILAGKDNQKLAEIASGLVGLKFSRDQEYEADEYAVKYLSKAGYKADEFANFFTKMDNMTKGGSPPEFLSTHPSDDSRVAKIKELWEANKTADAVLSKVGDFTAIKNSLP